ncbi:MAG: UDP-N-acetylglucosamine 2-epimerase (non-hydrolyzing) [Bryobacteraceae bacterium]
MTSPRDESRTGTSNLRLKPPQHILVIFGTRPEAIKLCPLIGALRKETGVRPVVCVTGQHREMLDQVLSAFRVTPDYDLNVMQPVQTLPRLTGQLMTAIEPVVSQERPAMIVVQGDTTTTLCGALSGFYANVPVAHVEAGLRTFDFQAPFPEEMNRVVTGRLATLHFAATEWAASNLVREGVRREAIEVTGNTGIDAVLAIRDALKSGELTSPPLPVSSDKKLIVITTHRRESFGEGLVRICQAVDELAARPDVQIVWPVHPNPQVRQTVGSFFKVDSPIKFLEPLDYISFVDLMARSYILITDSGGIQEEGPSLGKPILVLREKTERPEAVEAGTVRLVGTDRRAIVNSAMTLLDDAQAYEAMSRIHNPYGDGRASARISHKIATYCGVGG